MKDFKENSHIDSFVKVESWMLFDLGLSGADLLLYGLIYGYTLTCGGFTGSRAYLSFWLGCSLSTLDVHVNTFIGKGYVTKTHRTVNGESVVCLMAAREAYVKAQAAAEARRASLKSRPEADESAPENGAGTPSTVPDFGNPVTDDRCGPDRISVRGTPETGHNTDRYTDNYTARLNNAPAGANRARKEKETEEREAWRRTMPKEVYDPFFEAAFRRSHGDDAVC